jgi:hypothetical protein
VSDKSMGIDLGAALVYPYQEKNLKNTLLFPGLLAYVYFILVLLTMGGLFLLFTAFGMKEEEMKQAVDGLSQLITFPLNLLYSSILLGFQWAFWARFQQEGPQAEAPAWRENWRTFLKNGLKAYLFYYFCHYYAGGCCLWFFPLRGCC